MMSRTSVLVLAVLAALWWAVGALDRAMPPELIVIQAGPHDASYEHHAHRYAALLKKRGLRVEVRTEEDSLHIIDKLQDPSADVHIGFTGQHVDSADFPDVFSVGVIELEPLFLFLRSDFAEPATLAGLAGRKLLMPVDGSATNQAARDVLALYGVNQDNASFSYMPMEDAAAALQRGEHDGGFFMLAPNHMLIRRLATDPGLILYSIEDNTGIALNIDYMKAATLARGAFNLKAPQPPRPVALLGITVNVVVRAKTHPAVLYGLLEAMHEVHKGQTLISGHGEYPHQTGAALPVHPLAHEWAKTGTPRLYRQLPPGIATVVDYYWALILVLLALVSSLGSLQSLNRLLDKLVFTLSVRWLGWLQRRIARGCHPGWGSRKLFQMVEPVVVQQPGQEQRARDSLESVRPHM
jgi:TRAP-type uncharacterized transport system substrate-binding protein